MSTTIMNPPGPNLVSLPELQVEKHSVAAAPPIPSAPVTNPEATSTGDRMAFKLLIAAFLLMALVNVADLIVGVVTSLFRH